MPNNKIGVRELICVDWGSSNFRAFLVSADGTLVDAVNSTQGMLGLEPDEFEPTLFKQLENWPKLPIILAGMVGSLRGWCNTDYVTCPINVKKLAVNLTHIENTQQRHIAIVAGIENASDAAQYDVARGEEVQAIGAIDLIGNELEANAIFCLPGTHSKWMNIQKHKITNITTHMTGEIFDILTKYSILAPEGSPQKPNINQKIFLNGVDCAQKDGGLAHHIFSTRTNMLKGVLANDDIETYLSGILIGSEIHETLKSLVDCRHVYLIGNDKLNNIYSLALNHLGIDCTLVNGEQAAYTGMVSIAKQAKFI